MTSLIINIFNLILYENVQKVKVKKSSMQKIKLSRLENHPENHIEGTSEMPYVIVGEPCVELYRLQQEGYCVIAELSYLQGFSEEEVAEALGKEEAVFQYTNVCIDAEELPQAYLRRIWHRHKDEPVLIAETDRLIVRESVSEDAEAFLELYADKLCRRYLEAPPVALNGVREHDLEEYRRYIVQYQQGQYGFYEYGMWSVVEKASGRCIGRVGLEMQGEKLCLGYALLPQYRGKGYATEACMAVLDYCKECGYAEEVFVNISAENSASKKVYEKVSAGRDILKKIQ